jgi:hypothetical protein
MRLIKFGIESWATTPIVFGDTYRRIRRALSSVVGLYSANSYNTGDNMDFVKPSRDL